MRVLDVIQRDSEIQFEEHSDHWTVSVPKYKVARLVDDLAKLVGRAYADGKSISFWFDTPQRSIQEVDVLREVAEFFKSSLRSPIELGVAKRYYGHELVYLLLITFLKRMAKFRFYKDLFVTRQIRLSEFVNLFYSSLLDGLDLLLQQAFQNALGEKRQLAEVLGLDLHVELSVEEFERLTTDLIQDGAAGLERFMKRIQEGKDAFQAQLDELKYAMLLGICGVIQLANRGLESKVVDRLIFFTDMVDFYMALHYIFFRLEENSVFIPQFEYVFELARRLPVAS